MSHCVLVQGTALALPLRDASVHCVVTSPPYYGLRDYGTGTWQGGDAACTHVATSRPAILGSSSTLGYPSDGGSRRIGSDNQTHAAYTQQYAGVCGRCGATRVDAQLGLEASPDAYVVAMVQVFREVWRVMRPDATLFLNMGDSYSSGGRSSYGPGTNKGQPKDAPRPAQPSGIPEKNLLGMPWRLAFGLQHDGWILRSDIIWEKPSCMPESVQDRPTRSHEYVFLFSKQARYFYDAESIKDDATYAGKVITLGAKSLSRGQATGANIQASGNGLAQEVTVASRRNARTVWRIPSEPFSGSHFATFPPALVRRCLLAGAPSAVCSACGAPWKREVERESAPASVFTHRSAPEDGYVHSGSAVQGKMVGQGQKLQNWRDAHPPTTTGFTQTCACAADTQPCTVLDPFCGSGTTLLVARELGHRAIGLDLSYPYLSTIARERLGLADLARWEGRGGHHVPAVTYDDLPLFTAGGLL